MSLGSPVRDEDWYFVRDGGPDRRAVFEAYDTVTHKRIGFIVRFVTSRYDKNPLVVQGPGAGPAVTAGGVFADLLRVCAYLGAKL